MAITKLLKVEGDWVDLDDLNRILETSVNWLNRNIITKIKYVATIVMVAEIKNKITKYKEFVNADWKCY